MQEVPARHEQEKPLTSHYGLYGRLLMANMLTMRPNRACRDEDVDKIRRFGDRDYSIFQKTVDKDMQDEWASKDPDANIAERHQTWLRDMTHAVNTLRGNVVTNIYAPLFEKADIHAEELKDGFTRKHADKLYSRYILKQSISANKQGVKTFVSDVISAYSQNGSIDINKLQNDLPHLTWLASIFGRDADMVMQLTLAEATLQTQPDFREKLKRKITSSDGTTASRINNLHENERRILEHIVEVNKYPIMNYEQEIKKSVQENEVTVIIGGTGSGKTRATPQMVRDIMQPGERLVVTEPRRINVTELARGIAKEADVELGQEIGYLHGEGHENSDKTDTLLVTEKIPLLWAKSDPMLSEYSKIMIDEAHVLTTDMEMLFHIVKRANLLRKEHGVPAIGIIVASATMDESTVTNYYPGAHVIKVEGQSFPVTEHFSNDDIPSSEMTQAAAQKAADIINETEEGDIMIFVGSHADVRNTIGKLQGLENTKILSLTAQSSEEETDEAGKDPEPGERRIFVATNFPETGITVPGISYVINSGEEFEESIDPVTGLSFVQRSKHSQATSDQRRGRAGRVAAGECYYLYTESDYHDRQKYPTPQIKRSDLTPLLLDIYANGHTLTETDQGYLVDGFELKSGPLEKNITKIALNNLSILGLINKDGLTELGKRASEIITNLPFAVMIARAEQEGLAVDRICTLAALSEIRNIYTPGRDNWQKSDALKKDINAPESDFLTNLRIYEEFLRQGARREWAEDHGLNFTTLNKIAERRNKLLRKIAKRNAQSTQIDDTTLQRLVAQGFLHRLFRYDPGKKGYVLLSNTNPDITFKTGRMSVVSTLNTYPEYIISASNQPIEISESTRSAAKTIDIWDCQVVKPEWIK